MTYIHRTIAIKSEAEYGTWTWDALVKAEARIHSFREYWLGRAVEHSAASIKFVGYADRELDKIWRRKRAYQ